jgi:uncharacterized protein
MMAVMFIGDNPRLEAALDKNQGAPCAVITHPHPLYGGNMNNNVVMAARDAALANGFSALRFNFRGTGQSEGSHDNGKGEINDLCTAVGFAGKNPLIIGYSFGAWIASMYLKKDSLPCILISPPTAMFEVSLPEKSDVWVITSDLDQYADISKVRVLVPEDRLYLCPGIDHFWFGDEDVLTKRLNKILAGLKRLHEQ